jgi:hypothetical protein
MFEIKPETVKDLGGAFAGLGGFAYATGYFVLRARARVLGTDSYLGLLDSAYVFAGFRFLLALLVTILITLPVVVGVRTLASLVMHAAPKGMLDTLQWIALAALALLVVLQLKVLELNAVLLDDRATKLSGAGFLTDAALGRNNGGLWLTLATVALALLATLWYWGRSADTTPKGLSVPLGIVALLQLLMLPIFHGMFFADRTVRVLDDVPASAKSLLAPVGIVDRGGDYVTLFGANHEGGHRLVIIGKDDLKGCAVQGVVSLSSFLARIAPTATQSGQARAESREYEAPCDSAAKPPDQERCKKVEEREVDQTFWRTVTDYFKNALANIGALGEGRARAGQIWIAQVAGTTLKGEPHPVGSFTNLSWPVLGPGGYVYALEDRQVVRLGRNGDKTVLAGSSAPWLKLIGVSAKGAVMGLVEEPPFGKVAILEADGRMTVGTPPGNDEDRARHALLLEEAQAYRDGRKLTISYSQRGGRGLDIFITAPGSSSVNLSDCGDDSCGQPSLSPDGAQVMWIRARPP